MTVAEQTKNRAAFPIDELEKHTGKWVAFDPTCTKIIASHENVEELVKLVRQAGYHPQDLWIEGLPEGTIYGGLA
jgi:hypothetical protein